MDRIDFSISGGDLFAPQSAEVMAAAKAASLVAQMTLVDDPESPEGQEAIAYVNSHHWPPRDYRRLSKNKLEALGQTLRAEGRGLRA